MISRPVTLPDSAMAALQRSPTEIGRDNKLAEAMHWYQQGAISQERAAELAGLNRRDFIKALAREGLDVFTLTEESIVREMGWVGQ